MYETAPNRERVFQKALDLDQNIKELEDNLKVVQEQVNQSERKHENAANLYLLDNCEPSKRQNVTNMERTLENFYSSLKWIENATVDLKFQVDDISNRVDT